MNTHTSTPLLVIGNKNFSSSSLRAWLLLREHGVDFEEKQITLFKPDSLEKLGLYSPSLKVPVLQHEDIKVWDSLAICEYVNDAFLEDRGWPYSARKRAAARSVAAELHSGFSNLNRDWPMNCQVSMRLKPSPAVEEEIARLDAIMYCCRRKHGQGGDYLFGRFSIADCLMAPYAVALNAYGAQLNGKSRGYLQTLLDNPHLQCWIEEACQEIEELPLEQAV